MQPSRAPAVQLSFTLLNGEHVSETTDEALVIRSQHGDRTAFELLVRRTARLVFSQLYLQSGDAHRAEDLVQETFLIAWRRIAQVTDPTGFRTWLLSVAHSAAIDAMRRDTRKKRTGTRIGEAALGDLPAAGPSPPEAAEQAESRQRVLDVLRSLPREYQQVLMLRYIGGADYEQIGQQLHITNGSLRGLLARGMAMLRSRLTEQD
jgi:RNA polymerase sigma-70 factor (ECF subfamily)